MIVSTMAAVSAEGDTYTSYADGNWRDTGTVWHALDYPKAGDSATVSNSVTMTNDEACSILTLLTGDLNVNGNLLSISSNMAWSAGQFSYGNVDCGGVASLTGAGIKELGYLASFVSSNTLSHAGGSLFLDRSTWIMTNGGVYDVSTDGTLITHYSSGKFNNYGTFKKSGGGGGTTVVTAPFHDYAGTIVVDTGTLAFANSASDFTDTTIEIASGAVFDMTGGQEPHYSGLISGSGAGDLVISNGEAFLPNSATLDFPSGRLLWSGGNIDGGTLTNRTDLHLTGTNTKELAYLSVMVQRTNTYHTGTGDLYLDRSTWVNTNGVVYDIQVDGEVITGRSTGNFKNYGTIVKSAGGGRTTISADFHDYDATIDVNTGTLVFANSDNTFSNTQINVAEGATLDLTGGLTLTCRGNITGSGEGFLVLTNGSLDAPDVASLALPQSLFQWSGGEIDSGLLICSTPMQITGGSQKTLSFQSDFEQRANLIQSGTGDLYLDRSTWVITNGAIYDVQSTGTLMTSYSYGKLENYGTLSRSASTGTATVAADFRNMGGLVHAREGTLAFLDYTHNAGAIWLDGGDASFNAFTLQAGELKGTGTVSVATLTSAASIAPGNSTGILKIDGDYVQQTTGSLGVEIGGLNQGAEYDLLDITGSAALDGTLSVSLTNSFVPVLSNTFTVLSCGSLSGTFSNLARPSLPSGLAWRVSYDSTSAVLEVVGSISLAESSHAVTEGGSFTVTVARAGVTNVGMSVDYTTVDGSARAGFEYSTATGALYFAAGQTSATFVVSTLDNPYHDYNNAFSIEMGPPTGFFGLAEPDSASVTITEDDPHASAALPFMDPFAAGGASNAWAFYSDAAGRVSVTSSNAPRTLPQHMTMDSAVNLTYSLNEAVLSINATAESDLWLTFWHKEFNDVNHVMPSSFSGHHNSDGVAISEDGTNWFKLQGLNSGDGIGSTYRSFTVNLDDVVQANGLTFNSDFRIKFQQYDRYGIPSDGFAFDDIWVRSGRDPQHEGISPMHYVSPGGQDAWPYTNWISAATRIQYAVDAAIDGDTVTVSNGIYDAGGCAAPGFTLTNRVCVTNSITVQSVNGPDNTLIVGAEATGGGTGSDAIRCVYLTNSAMLSGFTLTNGATTDAFDTDGSGGGAFAAGATLTNCRLVDNEARLGGGLFGGTAYDCHSSFSWGMFGGGAADAVLYRCRLFRNSAQSGGGANNCRMYNCHVWHNSSTFGGGGVFGGPLVNCTIVSNSTAPGVGGGVNSVSMTNCIVYQNFQQDNYLDSTMDFTCTTPMPTSGVGNITEDPRLADTASGDLHLLYGSPCIDTASAGVSPSDDLDGNPRPVDGNFDGTNGFDMGAYEYNPSTADSDGDQMPDDWEHGHDLNPTNPADAGENPDGDPASNLHEWGADTDPTNVNSFFRITALSNLNSCTLWFPSSTSRIYSLQSRQSLVTSQWWLVSGAADEPGDVSGVTSLTDTNDASRRAYRVEVGFP